MDLHEHTATAVKQHKLYIVSSVPSPIDVHCHTKYCLRAETERGVHSGKPVGTADKEGGYHWTWFCLMAREQELLCYFLLTKHSTLLPSSLRWEFCNSVLNALQRKCSYEAQSFFFSFCYIAYTGNWKTEPQVPREELRKSKTLSGSGYHNVALWHYDSQIKNIQGKVKPQHKEGLVGELPSGYHRYRIFQGSVCMKNTPVLWK